MNMRRLVLPAALVAGLGFACASEAQASPRASSARVTSANLGGVRVGGGVGVGFPIGATATARTTRATGPPRPCRSWCPVQVPVQVPDHIDGYDVYGNPIWHYRTEIQHPVPAAVGDPAGLGAGPLPHPLPPPRHVASRRAARRALPLSALPRELTGAGRGSRPTGAGFLLATSVDARPAARFGEPRAPVGGRPMSVTATQSAASVGPECRRSSCDATL